MFSYSAREGGVALEIPEHCIQMPARCGLLVWVYICVRKRGVAWVLLDASL